MMNADYELQIFYPRNRKEWREWLEHNHQRSPGVWIIYYKKGTNQPTISYEEAVEDALSFGWIDSKVNSLDEDCYMQIFTPRKAGSTWSRLNKSRVKKIIKEGLMTPEGMEKVESAKKDGSWSFLDSVEDLIVPDDLKNAFEQNKTAENNYSNFSNSSKKHILFWIASAKRIETRNRRIKMTVKMAARNEIPGG